MLQGTVEKSSSTYLHNKCKHGMIHLESQDALKSSIFSLTQNARHVKDSLTWPKTLTTQCGLPRWWQRVSI